MHVLMLMRLGKVGHEEVAVVVVARVLLVEPRMCMSSALQRVLVLHVPVGHELHAVGIRVHGEDDVVVRNRIVSASFRLTS